MDCLPFGKLANRASNRSTGRKNVSKTEPVRLLSTSERLSRSVILPTRFFKYERKRPPHCCLRTPGPVISLLNGLVHKL